MNTMSVFQGKRLMIFIVAYLVVYFFASWTDLTTTTLGLAKPGVSEKNVFAINSDGYSSQNAWLLTVVGAVILTACVVESFRNSQRVEEHWLQYPVHSFGKLYLNPWSKEALKYTPIHFLSLALAFPLYRILAALNNLAVFWYGIAPLGGLMEIVAAKTSPLIGFSLIGFLFFGLITLVVAPFSARIIAIWKGTS